MTVLTDFPVDYIYPVHFEALLLSQHAKANYWDMQTNKCRKDRILGFRPRDNQSESLGKGNALAI
jgi:hypothetical protein